MVIEAMLERLCDLEVGDPYYYLVQKEQLGVLCALYASEPDLTIEKVKEVLENEEV
jgi:hypothetical protein